MKRKLTRIGTLAVALAAVAGAVFVMVRRIGLSDRFDFGAGAYYYADIPEFEGIVEPALEAGSAAAPFPFWLAALLFLVWGALVYALWVRMDRPRNKK